MCYLKAHTKQNPVYWKLWHIIVDEISCFSTETENEEEKTTMVPNGSECNVQKRKQKKNKCEKWVKWMVFPLRKH